MKERHSSWPAVCGWAGGRVGLYAGLVVGLVVGMGAVPERGVEMGVALGILAGAPVCIFLSLVGSGLGILLASCNIDVEGVLAALFMRKRWVHLAAVASPRPPLDRLCHHLQALVPVLYAQVLEPTLADLRQEYALAQNPSEARMVLMRGCGALVAAAASQLGYSFLLRIASVRQAENRQESSKS